MRYNILICAHEISPIQGSECAEGWNIVLELSKYHNLFILYASGSQFNPNSYKDAINDYFVNNLNVNNIQFISIDQPFFTKVLTYFNKIISSDQTSIGNPFIYFLGYKFWHISAYKKAKSIVKLNNIHLIHLLTSITFREPGYLWKLNLPYVWGPTGGLSKLPFSFKKKFNFSLRIKESIRELISFSQFYFKIKKSKIVKKCDLVYTFSKFDEFNFKNCGFKKVKILTDSGCSDFFNTQINNFKNNDKTFRILWVGQLIHRKSLNILIESISLIDKHSLQKIEIVIVGSGPLDLFYRNLVRKKNLDTKFKFIGQIGRQSLFNLMQNSEILVHTSYREATTNVIPEALSNKLPVICHDISGMSIAIDETCGIKIPLVSLDFSITKLTDIIKKLINDPEQVGNLKKGAENRAMQLSWNNLAKTISDDYIQIIKKS